MRWLRALLASSASVLGLAPGSVCFDEVYNYGVCCDAYFDAEWNDQIVQLLDFLEFTLSRSNFAACRAEGQALWPCILQAVPREKLERLPSLEGPRGRAECWGPTKE